MSAFVPLWGSGAGAYAFAHTCTLIILMSMLGATTVVGWGSAPFGLKAPHCFVYLGRSPKKKRVRVPPPAAGIHQSIFYFF